MSSAQRHDKTAVRLRRTLSFLLIFSVAAVFFLYGRNADARQSELGRLAVTGYPTTYAIEVAGLSWQPVWDARPLYLGKKNKRRFNTVENRWTAFESARRAGQERTALAYASSLVLDPKASNYAGEALRYLQDHGVNLSFFLLGVVQLPNQDHPLSDALYGAADLLVLHASPKLFPIFLAWLRSSDNYLKSRAILALGIIGYRPMDNRSLFPGLPVNLRSNGISADLRGMIRQAVKEGLKDGCYRVRAASAIAVALLQADDDYLRLAKLLKDPAYLQQETGTKKVFQIEFPVREAAAAALKWLNQPSADIQSGDFSGKELVQVRRGGHNVTHDFGGVNRKLLEGQLWSMDSW